MEKAPVDDCCPICFGNFVFPCRTNCGHWFCGSCILDVWKYGAALERCKCPMCCGRINSLTPEASALEQQELQVREVMENLERYNRLFVGGKQGLFQRVRESPLFIKRVFQEMMDPARSTSYLCKARWVAMALSILYTASPFDFIPTGGLGIVRLFDYIAIALVVFLHLVGVYRRRRLTQRVRILATSQS